MAVSVPELFITFGSNQELEPWMSCIADGVADHEQYTSKKSIIVVYVLYIDTNKVGECN